MKTKRSVIASLALFGVMGGVPTTAPGGNPSPKLRTYQTKYYVIHSDLDVETVREAVGRVTGMAEEYHRRTRGFAGTVRKRLPLYLFSDEADYYAAGGLRGSSGMYNGKALMALAPKNRPDRFWEVVQHEGFHQFANTVISRRLPVWVGEGLAEYFGHGIWTGDNFVTGMIPPTRLERVKEMIKDKRLLPLVELITMTHTQWNAALRKDNYDQAWSMVHFLVHGDGGKYQKAFASFVNDIAAHRPWKLAFTRRFGRDLDAFQRRYSEWWTSLNEDPTAEKYVLATVQTLTSYLARSWGQGQRFNDAEAFFRTARAGELKMDPERWLPPKLLRKAMEEAGQLKTWSLETGSPRPTLVLSTPKGTRFTGTFTLHRGRSEKVEVAISYSQGATQPQTSPASKNGR